MQSDQRAGRFGPLRAAIPLLFLPLCLTASVLSAAPWLRSFPVSVAGAPLYGAALLSVLIPLLTVRARPNWLLLSIGVDTAVFVLYALVVVLQDPTNVGDLVQGLYRGPSQVLTFALPLVSPRSLMVAPVALTWLAGALAGECVARRWSTMLPYASFLIAFGLAYAGTQRAAGSDVAAARERETLLAAGLLVTLLLMRTTLAWVRQDETAESTQPDGILPLRGLVVGIAAALVITVASSLLVQIDAFPKRSDTPQRVPTVNDSRPLTPLSFVAGLRPRNAKTAKPVFTVSIDKPNPGYFAVANVDLYDGSGWSFDRTFRPSGGILPADTDLALPASTVVTQQYRIVSGPLTSAPWMPFMYRPQRVTGTSVNIDPSSGMIVPAGKLRIGASYSVRSGITAKTFDQLKTATATADTNTPTIDTEIPEGLRTTLERLITSFGVETGTPTSPALPFLQALQKDLRNRYALSGAAQGSSVGTPSPSPSASASSGSTPTPGASPSSPSTSNTAASADLAGGTGFADVLASILGPSRNGTPEQFATLVALVARDLGVPARVVTGFRLLPTGGATRLAAGRYDVTTADAWSWIEVPIVGTGWTVLDASPGRFAKDNQKPESASPVPSEPTTPSSRNALVTQGDGHAAAPKSTIPAPSSSSRTALVVALLLAVAALLVVLLLILLLRKPIRSRRRRNSPDPRTRLISAWQESLDVLSEAGLPELTALTSAEVAELTSEQFGAESGAQAAALGAVANAVAYSAATVVAPQDADRAWSSQRSLRKQVRRQLGLRERLASSLRYNRPKQTARPTSPPSWAFATAAARAETLRSAQATRRRYHGKRRAH